MSKVLRKIIDGRVFGIGKNIAGIFKKAVIIPAATFYGRILFVLGSLFYNSPERSLEIIGITGSSGKSTTLKMALKIFEDQSIPVAGLNSSKIEVILKDGSWTRDLGGKPVGQLALQKFLRKAANLGIRYVMIELSPKDIVKNRFAGLMFKCAVLTNINRSHAVNERSFTGDLKAHVKFFRKCAGTHIINLDDHYYSDFMNIPCGKRITYGMTGGMVNQESLNLKLNLAGDFNIHNALAAVAIANACGIDEEKAASSAANIKTIPGRMEFLDYGQSFKIVIDYARTPDSLEAAYRALKSYGRKMIGVIGASGGKERWKRPVLGCIANAYCDEIILTSEDPRGEDPLLIIEDIKAGIPRDNVHLVADRGDAIKKAILMAKRGDIVVITGKGDETKMAVSGLRTIPWSDKETAAKLLIES
ncbi:MAG: UDP-N-acetylmuramoyl-L-alanyl-D-glutamate--2,6-diaminopimelate ligase [Parcubacteria group bacterium Licking1014_17]|nr:MAG: UDP-N-acetylmuramoyl-L-alanyl-D-glutamate--2,6-diaminopimelate ligase [Parcubacteria group bacterium Licking1014_17]